MVPRDRADPAEQAVHHAILRAFAAHGRAPTAADLTAVAAEFDRSAEHVLARLHDSDVIRLDPSGNIASAYPTSATPHRVRIDNGATMDSSSPTMVGPSVNVSPYTPWGIWVRV
ncbi:MULTISPECIES: hypothetical protein [Rhodococcus]|uniref:LexA repressor DNA-binding domain-containing protein n=1 Tax=Rhodococcus pseudokoreensis TaxID=2811421 RepID=A0A974VYV3_9NOCA|nr:MULTISPECIES: hypothetical protein [Rhodococcus]MBV6761441.1 hypothetical protein [Rhodococcus opacus]QSE87709.1 hypothetical protein JWS13_03420 [Rhodococcus pseudokoreensis]